MFINDETALASYYQESLPQFISESLVAGFWQRPDAALLHYRYVINPDAKAWIVLVQGRSESVVKYAEFIDELYRNGFSVFAFDHIGQGQSSRLTDNPLHGFVSNFDEYVEDAAALIKQVLHPLQETHGQASLPNYLLGHSMGGAISTLLLMRHPALFSKAVLCSPMYGIATPIPAGLAKILVSVGAYIHRLLGIQSGYFLGQGDYKDVPFKNNKLTSSEVRYRWFKQYYNDNVDARLGGVTFQWLAAALQAIDTIEQQASALKTPLLMLKAGSDQIVDNKAIDSVFVKLPQASLLNIDGAQHEILFERDRYRRPAVEAILAFLLDKADEAEAH
ncbi:alpha/beta fold hydrolase [Glaciecola siphonariae]|uniref:Alpha/beta fold hydrolase n=1 Tax=Glaciecola siphonariae TaxID=521012 RepID=A0ABV9LWK0_9ALTE